MAEARLSVRVDEEVKEKAENVFHELGLTMSSGINLYLKQVVSQRGIPFPVLQASQKKDDELDFRKQIEELRAQIAVNSIIVEMQGHNVPIALYDEQQKRPYLMYPDGRRVYELE